jgi:ABC-2 type transport system permease protein
MNRQHLGAILWLRWRTTVHQTRRAGVASVVILAILGALVAAASVGFFFLGLFGGIAAFSRISPESVMLLWDGVAVTFLFFWMIGLVTELQRSEVLSLQKLLHLPVSPAGAFAINYVGSLASLSLAIFLPGMVGLSIAQVVVKGPAALLMFPLLAGFLLMVTAITYQFQGWLASLMVNKRRRRTVIAVVTVSLMLISQLPNLLNNYFWSGHGHRDALWTKHREDVARLDRARETGEITSEQYGSLYESSRSEYARESGEQKRERKERVLLIAQRVNLLVPLGWLPLGAMGCARGSLLSALLGTLGAGLIGAASLRRSYRTTLRLYSGHFTSGRGRRPPAPTPAQVAPAGTGFLERDLPGLSGHAAAVALVNFRSLTRAPEAKMALLTPVILVLLYGSMMLTRHVGPPEAARPFMGLAASAMVLLSLSQLIGNQFALDRDGFRALVLSPSPRRDILLGKNLSLAPPALGLGLLLLAAAQAVYPMRIDHLLAAVAELGSTFLIFCMVANLASILVPVPLASGSLRPAHPKAGQVLVQLILLLVLPILIGLAVLPLGVELLLHHLGWMPAVPLYLICSLPELVAIAWVYRRVIGWQGRLLQAREQRILEVVTTRVE